MINLIYMHGSTAKVSWDRGKTNGSEGPPGLPLVGLGFLVIPQGKTAPRWGAHHHVPMGISHHESG